MLLFVWSLHYCTVYTVFHNLKRKTLHNTSVKMELSQINDVPQIISLPISEDANTVQSYKFADASEADGKY